MVLRSKTNIIIVVLYKLIHISKVVFKRNSLLSHRCKFYKSNPKSPNSNQDLYPISQIFGNNPKYWRTIIIASSNAR